MNKKNNSGEKKSNQKAKYQSKKSTNSTEINRIMKIVKINKVKLKDN